MIRIKTPHVTGFTSRSETLTSLQGPKGIHFIQKLISNLVLVNARFRSGKGPVAGKYEEGHAMLHLVAAFRGSGVVSNINRRGL